MTHQREPAPLNGANAYGSSLMNPFAFSDEELLRHVTPAQNYPHRDCYQQAANSRSPSLQIPGLLNGTDTGGLAELASFLDAGEATSAARPDILGPEVPSRSTCSPSSPPQLAAAYSAGLPLPQGLTEPNMFDFEHAESRDGLEDPADHREKNRVAQKKFRARQKVSIPDDGTAAEILQGLISLQLTALRHVQTHQHDDFAPYNVYHEQAQHVDKKASKTLFQKLQTLIRFMGT